jgi:diketogulonate reductase-like aldo/keto reductase/predicted transcriptional regulator
MQLTVRPILEQLGLTENEIKVYEALLKRKSVVAATLAREIGLDKSSTYRALESMTEQGLVIVERKKRGTTYQIGSLQILKDSLQKKMLSLKNTERGIDDVIESIKNQALTGERDTYIKVEKGIDAHISFMERSLEGKEKINREIFPSTSGTFFKDQIYDNFSRNFLLKRVSKNIYNRALYRFSGISTHKDIMRTSEKLKKDLRILPDSLDNYNYMLVWDDNVEILSFTEDKSDFVVIQIKDRVVAELVKQLFEYVFERSAKYYNQQVLPIRKIRERIVPVIGIGTWGIGGYATQNPYTRVVEEVDNLRYALGTGMTYIDISHAYGAGYGLPIIAKTIANYSREDLFINAKIGYQVKKLSDVEKMVDRYLSELKIDYLDQIMIHSPLAIDLPIRDVIKEMERMAEIGKAKYLAVANFNIEQLKEAQAASKYGISAHELHYNLMIRANEENGVIDYCRKEKIMLIAYQPLRRGFLAGIEDDTLRSLAQKYDKTQSQIILNWMASKEYLMFLVKATRGSHINENVAALGWKMDKKDYKLLDDWRMPGYVTPKYDVTGKSKDGLKIWKL